MKDISERAFPKGHFDEGHFEGRAFTKGERAKGMKGIVHKLEFSPYSLVVLLLTLELEVIWTFLFSSISQSTGRLH